MSFLSRIWLIFAVKLIVVSGFVHAAFYHSIMGTNTQTFERKHGQWKLIKILPVFLMALFCINVTSVQAASLQVHTICPVKTKASNVLSTHLAFLFDKWKESLDTHSSFKKLLDLIEPHQPLVRILST